MPQQVGMHRWFADNRNWPITKPVSADSYLLCIMMALDTEIIYFLIWTDDTNFRFLVIQCESKKIPPRGPDIFSFFSQIVIYFLHTY